MLFCGILRSQIGPKVVKFSYLKQITLLSYTWENHLVIDLLAKQKIENQPCNQFLVIFRTGALFGTPNTFEKTPKIFLEFKNQDLKAILSLDEIISSLWRGHIVKTL